MTDQNYPGIVNAGMVDDPPSDRSQTPFTSNDKLSALKRLSVAWGPHSEDGKLTGWAASEIERLDADACNERSERESWQAIAKTRESERDQLRAEVERLTRELSEYKAEAAGQARWAQERGDEANRLRAALLNHVCNCGPTDPDPSVHREDCAYRLALSGEHSAPETVCNHCGGPHCDLECPHTRFTQKASGELVKRGGPIDSSEYKR